MFSKPEIRWEIRVKGRDRAETFRGDQSFSYPQSNWEFFFEIMRPELEANYSPSSNTEAKYEYVFMARYLIKRRDNFIL